MHQSQILQCTILSEKCEHVCTFLLQYGALWDTCPCILGFMRWFLFFWDIKPISKRTPLCLELGPLIAITFYLFSDHRFISINEVYRDLIQPRFATAVTNRLLSWYQIRRNICIVDGANYAHTSWQPLFFNFSAEALMNRGVMRTVKRRERMRK